MGEAPCCEPPSTHRELGFRIQKAALLHSCRDDANPSERRSALTGEHAMLLQVGRREGAIRAAAHHEPSTPLQTAHSQT